MPQPPAAAPTAAAQRAGESITNWKQASAGGYHTCGVTLSGRAYCWGGDLVGQLGNGPGHNASLVPTQVAGAATDWAAISAGGQTTCALKTSGRLFCWGSDRQGQVGDGPNLVNRPSPTPVANGGTSWATLSAGFNHTCGVRTTRELFCWGDDDAAQLGAPGQDTVDRPVPTEVVGNATNWAAVTGGGGTCARKTDNRVFCWGLSSRGQTGNNSPFPFEARPVEIAGGIVDWASVTSGGGHSCAVRAAHTLYCWGFNDWGQIGNGGSAIPWITVPVQIAP